MYLLGPPSKLLPWKEQRFRHVYFFSVKRAWRCETASAARLVQLIVRRAVSHAPSTFGGSADNMRRQVPVLMTMTQRHSLSSFAIDSVKRRVVATLGNDPDPERFPGCDNEFGAELISHPPVPREGVVSLNEEPAIRQPQIKWPILLYGESWRPLVVNETRSVGWKATLLWRFGITLSRGKADDLPSIQSGIQRPKTGAEQGKRKGHRPYKDGDRRII